MVGDSQKADIQGAQKMNWNYLKINRNKTELLDYEIGNLEEIKNYCQQWL